MVGAARPRRRAAALALLPLAAALAGCAAPTGDADGDRRADEAERVPYQLYVITRDGQVVRHVTSDPALADTDGDGLLDGEEEEGLTDPRDVDTDGDGLLDGRDLRLSPGDPRFDLLVGRGIVRGGDGRFLGELDAGTKPFDWDGDRPFPDGLSDGEELQGWEVRRGNGTVRVASDPHRPDTDGDGLVDLLERERGCDPRSADTDGDGTRDPVDAACDRNVLLRIEVLSVTLVQNLDPAGETDLVLTVQAGGLQRVHTQGLRAGENAVGFRWVADVPDDGLHGQLRVPVALTFHDQDLLGDDDRSGVDKQPICIAGSTGACHVLVLEVDVFARRFTGPGGLEGVASGESRGRDGAVRFSVQPEYA